MKKKVKTLLFSVLCLSMVNGYCLPTFANEESSPQDVNEVVEENKLPEETEKVEGETETEIEVPVEGEVTEFPETEEALIVEDVPVTEAAFYTFTTNQFSTYVIGFTDGHQTGSGETKPETKPEDKEETKKDDSVNTATETNTSGFMTMMFMLLAALLLVVGIKRLESNR